MGQYYYPTLLQSCKTGRIREFTGTVVYTWDDDGKEVAP